MTNNKKYYPWIVVALLWGVALLNYMDRQTDAFNHEVCHDDRYYRTGISHELRTPDGGILVDIRPDEPGRRHDRRPDQPEMADRRQSLRLVVRHADDGIFD